jgi:hypothetical protein
MSSAVAVNHLTSRLKVRNYAYDPADATVAGYIGWVDLRDFTHLLVALTMVVPTGHIATFALYASTKFDGSDVPVLIRQHADPTNSEDAGDQVNLECSAQELEALGSNLRYVSAKVTGSNAADVMAAAYVLAAKNAKDALTVDVAND